MNKTIYTTLLKAFLKICIAGVFIGYFHQYDTIVAGILILKVIHSMYSLGFRGGTKHWAVPIGMVLTMLVGVLIEIYGTHKVFWEYHDIPTSLPVWLPFAWMLSFTYIYKLEKELFSAISNITLTHKALITFLLTLFFPAFGEIITIKLGVWTYYLPYQLFGVPLYALIALVIVHFCINGIIYFIFNKYNLKDPVFNTIQ